MTVRVGINGFGRIGRNFLRAARILGEDVQVVAVNDLTSATTNAHLLRYDSTHGRFQGEVRAEGDVLVVDDQRIRVLAEREPKALPWQDMGVEVVIESTGRFTSRNDAASHLEGGARRVIISAPSKDADATFVIGVNDHEFDPQTHIVVSNASCTTNCFVPMVKVLDDAFGVDQRPHDDGARLHQRPEPARPSRTTTCAGPGPPRSTSCPPPPARPGPPAWCCPGHEGPARRHVALRVPGARRLDHRLHRRIGARRSRSRRSTRPSGPPSTGPMAGHPGLHRRPDRVVGHRRQPGLLHVRRRAHHGDARRPGQTLVKVLGWYDNEWGYSNRLVDLTALMGGSRPPERDPVPTEGWPVTTTRPIPRRPALLEDLPDVRGRRSWSAPTSTCPCVARRRGRPAESPTTSASARPCPRSTGSRARSAGSPSAPTSAGPRARPIPSSTGPGARPAWPSCAPGVELLENLRFDPGEEGNDPAFVERAGRRASTAM